MTKVIYNKFIPFKSFYAINICGIIFVRSGLSKISKVTLNHEEIHTVQMKELGYILFYILYLIEWIYRLITTKNAYRSISFEKEAYDNQWNYDYLKTRKYYNFKNYF